MKSNPVTRRKPDFSRQRRRFAPLWSLLCLSCLSLACQLSSVVLTPTAVPRAESGVAVGGSDSSLLNDTQEASLLPGYSRANPLPVGQTAVAGQYAVTILETMRGDDAWQEIHLVNANNPPAPEGQEYLLVKMRVVDNGSSEEADSIGLHVTGDGRVVHFSFDSGVVSPEPALETDLAGGETSEGWEAYLIRQDESNLMLIMEDYTHFDTPNTYLAVEEGASIAVDRETMLGITPTDLGTDAANPAPFGQTATAEDWQIIVTDVLWGEQAWEVVLDANQFNDPPPEGMMYVLVNVRVRYIGLADGEHNVSDSAFTLLTSTGEEMTSPSVVSPEPELFFDLYAGGEVTGWIVLQAPQEAKNLALYFNPAYDGSGVNGRYLSLGQGR
jgi:hypothetical protein